MKFIVIVIDDGGADSIELTDKAEVVEYLESSVYWKRAARAFANRPQWNPGDAMAYPCGWVFCVHDEVSTEQP